MYSDKSLNGKGLYEWPIAEENDPPVLLQLIIYDEPDNCDTSTERIYHPTPRDIKKASYRYGFDFEEIMDIIANMDPCSHTLLIDMPQYLKSP